jgi:hypothetical protein
MFTQYPYTMMSLYHDTIISWLSTLLVPTFAKLDEVARWILGFNFIVAEP